MFDKKLKNTSVAALVLGLSFFATPSYAQEICFVNFSNVPFAISWGTYQDGYILTPNNAYCQTMGGGDKIAVDYWMATDADQRPDLTTVWLHNQIAAPLNLAFGSSDAQPQSYIPLTYWGSGIGYLFQEGSDGVYRFMFQNMPPPPSPNYALCPDPNNC